MIPHQLLLLLQPDDQAELVFAGVPAVGGPYRVEEGRAFCTGAEAGGLFVAGAVAGREFHTGSVVGSVKT